MIPRPVSHNPAIGPGVAGPSLAVPSPYVVDKPTGNSLQVPLAGSQPFAVDPAAVAGGDPKKHTQYPYVTGTSVMGIIYKDGVMLASDTLGSYGATKRYKDVDRVRKVSDSTIIGASGELSDFNYIMTDLEDLVSYEYCADDGIQSTPEEIFAYLTRVMYNRRNKFDPLWNSLIVGGFKDGKKFLGVVSMIGMTYTDGHVATGFANHLARPIFREKHSPDMSEEAAVSMLHEALRVCYYRDKNSMNKFQIAKVTADGVKVSEPFALDTKWDYRVFKDPAAFAVGAW